MSLDKYKVKNETQDENNEVVKYYNDDYEPIGVTTREEGIKNNLLLEAVQIWIIDPKTKQVLMQRRSKNKGHDSNLIDVSASGHVREDETPIQAILRETSEEIGLKQEELSEKLKKIGIVGIDFSRLGRNGRYFTHEYIAYLDHPVSYYKKQDEEVEELFFMKYEEIKKRVRDKDKTIRIPYTKECEELFYKIDYDLYNLEANKSEKEK